MAGSSSSREEQARERRRQLVAIAGALIEERGADAVTLPAVTERAGCARTLVYRYFDSREALLIAVVDDYFERLDARVSEADQRAAVAATIESGARGESDPTRRLVELFWDAHLAGGLGGAVLRATPLLSEGLQSLVDESRDRFERRFTEPLRAAGLTELEAESALDSMIAGFVRLALAARDGRIGRDEAIDIHTRATVGLLSGLLARS